MSKQNVEQLEEILPAITVTVLGKYFVIEDGQFRWTGEVADVTDLVLRKVKKIEKGWKLACLEVGVYNVRLHRGYDELCELVEPVEDEAILSRLTEEFGESVSSL